MQKKCKLVLVFFQIYIFVHQLRNPTQILARGVSIGGIGEFDPQMARPDDLIRSADDKLYEAKRAGRNRVG